MGEIRIPESIPYFGITEDGHAINLKTGKHIALNDNGHGYKQVAIMVRGKRYIRYIHRLVAECFVANPENYKEVNHKDGNKANNNAENLEWCSRSENLKHAYRTGLKPRTTAKQQQAARENAARSLEALRQGWEKWSKTDQARSQWLNNLKGVKSYGERKECWNHHLSGGYSADQAQREA